MVFQDPYSSLDPRMTVGRSIGEALPRGVGRRPERDAEVARLLELVGLDPIMAGVRPSALSGGQRQRVAIARALSARPGVVIADEITSALDVSVQSTVLNLIRQLQRELGLTMLFISHDLAVVRYVADVIAVMCLGQVVEQGPAERVLSDPQHPYTRELLAAIPQPGTRLRDDPPTASASLSEALSGESPEPIR
jgi:peptide/nickel transport system ATP-binding protein